MKRGIVLLVMMLFMLSTGCSSNDAKMSNTEEMSAADSWGVQNNEESVVQSMDFDSEVTADDSKQDRMVIFHGNITIEIKDYHAAAEAIKEETVKLGGYVVESTYQEDHKGRPSGEIVVRVPKQYFFPFLEQISKSDGKVLDQHTSGNDITEEYVDLDSRLNAKRVVEERLLGFMEKADSTDNLLKISNELATVQEAIDQILGRMKYLENQVELSTITVYMQERRVELSSFQDGGSLHTWERSKNMFISTINDLLNMSSGLIVFLIGLSPVLIPLFFIGAWLIWKRMKKKKSMDEKHG
ncbi:DUF4349 domain-containing protein [bacterium LRH843]|nr:DUF4349 domain-containing protein [bacterium LRH843]